MKNFKIIHLGKIAGDAIGCVLDGVPSGIKISKDEIQKYLEKENLANQNLQHREKEPDQVKILSGIFNGVTTGTPISLQIENIDKKSKDYSDILDKFRPGHADYTYQEKFGIRDYRGGGRASARETAMRVAAGAIARKLLGKNVNIRGFSTNWRKKINRNNWSWNEVDKNPFFCPDKNAAKDWEIYLNNIRKEGSSVGAIIEIQATGIKVGLGEPIFDKIDALIAHAIMSIPAVKGVEIGLGFQSAESRGEENSDEIVFKNEKVSFKSNNSGGILGGITTGQDIVVRFAVKPTSSILIKQKTVNIKRKCRDSN